MSGLGPEANALAAPLREAGVPVIAALGNHEYWGGGSGEARFFARFPHLEGQRWYTRAWGPLSVIVVDSNVGFPPQPVSGQAKTVRNPA